MSRGRAGGRRSCGRPCVCVSIQAEDSVMKAVLISTYEMGRQPFGLASPAAWLKAAGWDVVCIDAAKQALANDSIASADLIAFHLPMHTATRLAAPVITSVRSANQAARL